MIFGVQGNQYSEYDYTVMNDDRIIYPGIEFNVVLEINNYTNIAGRSVGVFLTNKEGSLPLEIGYTDTYVAPNSGFNFVSIRCSIDNTLNTFIPSSGYYKNLYFYFVMFDAVGGYSGSYKNYNTTFDNIGDNDYLIAKKYPLQPVISALSFKRAAEKGGIYQPNNEGLYAICDMFKISIYKDASINDIRTRDIRITNKTTGEDVPVNLTNTILQKAITTNGYYETTPTLLNNFKFQTIGAYDITITIGDAIESTTVTYTIERAFANMHLSGTKNGGVAFGGFCNSTDDDPKFECFYPVVLWGGIEYIDPSGSKAIGNLIYPVGSAYITDWSSGNDPRKIYGGDWEFVGNIYMTNERYAQIYIRTALYDPEKE